MRWYGPWIRPIPDRGDKAPKGVLSMRTQRRQRWMTLACCIVATATVLGVGPATAGTLEKTAVTALAADTTPPVTRSTIWWRAYFGPTTIKLRASDAGSGVAATYYRIGRGRTHRGWKIHMRRVGTFTVRFWSVDRAGNVEDRSERSFRVLAKFMRPIYTSISLRTTSSSVSLGGSAVLSGILAPGRPNDRVRILVRRPGSDRWSTLSAVRTYSSRGRWRYRFAPTTPGTYRLKAGYAGAPPKYADKPCRWMSTSRTINVTVL